MNKIVLASGSPRRKMLLNQIGIPFDIIVSDTKEMIDATLPPEELVIELSKQKAMNVADTLEEDYLVIGADTVVVFNERILGKPKDNKEAYEMLTMLQGNCHEVYTGVSIINTSNNAMESDFEKTEVYMRPLPSFLIHSYINTLEPMDKAGAYGIQEKGALFIDKICGDYYNVVGLPLKLLLSLTEKMDIDLFNQYIFTIRS